jgi:hypothetical protein
VRLLARRLRVRVRLLRSSPVLLRRPRLAPLLRVPVQPRERAPMPVLAQAPMPVRLLVRVQVPVPVPVQRPRRPGCSAQ